MGKSIIARGINRMYTKIMVPLKEKKYVSGAEEGDTLRYMLFEKRSSSILVVGFQACNDFGVGYCYVHTLEGLPVSRLYIRDDFAANGLGNYYLGCNGCYNVEKHIFELIDVCAKRCGARTLVFIGSSKGGYAALNFGLRYPNARIIVAAPQYHLGQYLDNEKFRPNLTNILGEGYSAQAREQLDSRLSTIIQQDGYASGQRIALQYSIKEHTYPEHIKDMLVDLKRRQIPLVQEVMDYSNHADLRYYYPDFLCRCVRDVIREKAKAKQPKRKGHVFRHRSA